MNILQAWLAGSGGGIDPLAFIFKVVTETENESVTLPLAEWDPTYTNPAVYDFTVQFGANPAVPVVAFNDPNATFVFATPGEYEIIITGVCENFSVQNALTPFNAQIREIVQWGSIGALGMDFFSCSYLTAIPADLVGGFSTLISARYMFSQCTGLTEIPDGLFNAAVNVTDISSIFSITGITSIPFGLFSTMTQVTDASRAFSGSPITTAPGWLFSNMPQLTTLYQTFNGCNSLTSIGSGLLANNPLLNLVEGLFAGTAITSVPTTLFWSNSAITSFNNVFSGCTSLASIDHEVFKNSTAATSFTETFSSCTALTSIPADLFTFNVNALSFNETFWGCMGLTSLPSNLFVTCTKVTSFRGTFKFCQFITSTPANLFAGSSLVTIFTNTFQGCIRLSTLDSNMFPVVNTKTLNFTECFMTCTGLTAIPGNLLDNMPNITGFTRMFHIPSAPGLITGNLPTLWTRVTPGIVKTDCFHNRTAASNYATATTNGWT